MAATPSLETIRHPHLHSCPAPSPLYGAIGSCGSPAVTPQVKIATALEVLDRTSSMTRQLGQQEPHQGQQQQQHEEEEGRSCC